MGAAKSGRLIIRDSETFAADSAKIEFDPGNTTYLPRLDSIAKLYERYRFISLVVEYEPTSGTATTGSVAMCLIPGPIEASIKDRDAIIKSQPNVVLPAWKAGKLRAGKNLDASRFLHTESSGDTGVSCTLYIATTTKDLGYIRVSYQVEVAFPRPI